MKDLLEPVLGIMFPIHHSTTGSCANSQMSLAIACANICTIVLPLQNNGWPGTFSQATPELVQF